MGVKTKKVRPAGAPAVRQGSRSVELVEAAARVFAAKGYGFTSIQDIADEVGLLKGSLYHYIDTKEDLLFEVIRSTIEVGQDLVASLRASNAPTIERLRTYILNNIEGSLHSLDRTAVFVHDFQALSAERRKVILDLRQEHDVLLRQLIQAAQEEGIVSREVNVKLVALSVLTMNGSLYRWFDPSGEMSAREVSRDLTAFVLRGLGVPAELAAPAIAVEVVA